MPVIGSPVFARRSNAWTTARSLLLPPLSLVVGRDPDVDVSGAVWVDDLLPAESGRPVELHVTAKTIEYRKYQIMLKLHLQTSPQLISYAVKHGKASA